MKELNKLISETPDFEDVTETKGVPLLTDEAIRTAARKYIRVKLEMGDETPQEAKEGDPKFVPLEPGFDHVNVQEALYPEEAMIKAGFQNKGEMLKMLEAIRRDATMLDVRKGELDRREAGIAEGEAQLSGRQASVEKKAQEVGEQYSRYQIMFAQVEEARKKGIIV